MRSFSGPKKLNEIHIAVSLKYLDEIRHLSIEILPEHSSSNLIIRMCKCSQMTYNADTIETCFKSYYY